jgi:hypothetical protein
VVRWRRLWLGLYRSVLEREREERDADKVTFAWSMNPRNKVVSIYVAFS